MASRSASSAKKNTKLQILHKKTFKSPKIYVFLHIFQSRQVGRIGVFAGLNLAPGPYIWPSRFRRIIFPFLNISNIFLSPGRLLYFTQESAHASIRTCFSTEIRTH